MIDLLWTLAGYGFLAAIYYAGIMYPVLWFRRRYTVRIVRRHHATV